ncbi:MAG: adenylate/guanylate cyclase domain-containing protein, partial [Deltaproteobacteria bacterium]|nr:adenylate/guanylate cyclase domain-containing protein [Deltaproteobacteria bacterium]
MSIDQKVTRKLRAILSADVKGYSLLMADDEVHTIRTLKAYRNLMSDFILQYSGRVVDNPGDNLLAEFSSAVDAVECAVQVQNKLKKENARFVEDNRLEFRIGVNIGDVVHDGDRIYGSGVNVAARIEGIADPGGICISRNTYDHVNEKLDLGFEYLGEHEVKNIKEPVRIYKVLLDAEQMKPLEEEPERSEKPSIAVLPFNNMSGDPEQEYFSDGITEDITTALSRSSMLFVISRSSSFTYRGSAVDVRKVSQELGVRYILEGSVRKAGNHIRVTAQLIDGTTGKHIWAEKYDGELQDIFDLQDTITQQVAATIEPQIYLYAGKNNIKVDRKNIATWDVIARAWKLIYEYKKEAFISAVKLLRKAVASTPNSCEINFLLAAAIIMQVILRYSSNSAADS